MSIAVTWKLFSFLFCSPFPTLRDGYATSVLYIVHDPRLSDTKPIAFLTTRNADTEEFNRRKGKYRKLYQEARARLEATNDGHGNYTVNGHYALPG